MSQPTLTAGAFPVNAQKVLDALYKGVGAQDTLQRIEYWRNQQESFVSVEGDEAELRAREMYFLVEAGLLD